ncbi:hypothetical protein PBRA_007964 [Plasmodiophora brassicae]|uniref:Major facilitator superfamily associated domain-containing protein n=1 Tax=Plasmodiophora brassicae TaxID=37360 RepID=A0A0G4IY39_PLABS|nr:hypothetical protein PBRA_007964 [Plasmodiophora brassicae]
MSSGTRPRLDAGRQRPRIVPTAMLLLYLIMGLITSLPMLPARQLLMTRYHVEPSSMAYLLGIVSIPWFIKPVLGFWTDSFPIYQERRRPYIAVAMVGSLIVNLLLAYAASRLTPIAVIILLLTLATAMTVLGEVAINSIVIVNAKLETNHEVGTLQSTCWIWRAIGMIVGSGLGGLALKHLTSDAVEVVFTAVGSCAVAGLAMVPFLFEAKLVHGQVDSFATRLRHLAHFWRQRDVLHLTFFVVILNGMPTIPDTFLYWMRNRLGFDFGFFGNLDVVKHCAHLAMAVLFRASLRQVPIRQLLATTIAVSAMLGLSTIVVVQRWNLALRVPDQLFVLVDTLATAVCKELMLMPIVILAARIAPDGVEGSSYSGIMAIWNLSRIVSEEMGGVLTYALGVTSATYDRMWILVLVSIRPYL